MDHKNPAESTSHIPSQQSVESKKIHHSDNNESIEQQETRQCVDNEEIAPPQDVGKEPITSDDSTAAEDSGRERLKKHRVEVAGRVWIPEIWGQEKLLEDWIDCSAFDDSLVPAGIISARTALVQEERRTSSSGLRIENRC